MARAIFETVLERPTGAVDSVRTVALKNTDGTPFSGAVYANPSGGSPIGNTLSPNSQGRVEAYTDTATRMKATYDGVTVNSAFWPDAGDIMTYSAATAGGLDGELRDKGGWTFHLETFAAVPARIRGTSPAEDPVTAWLAAAAALAFVGGGILVLGPHTYLDPTVAMTWPSNVTVTGTPGLSTIRHRSSSNTFPIYAPSVSNFHLRDIVIDGNVANNLAYPYAQSEVYIKGTDISVIGCTIKDFNVFGVLAGGTRVRINDNQIYVNNGNGAASYATLTHLATDFGYQGYVGVGVTGGLGVCKDIEICRNQIAGLRGPAIFAGGSGVKILDNTCRNNHRYYCLTPGDVHTGGGQIANSQTDDGLGLGGLLDTTDFVISGNTVDPPPAADVVTFGKWNNGIELNSCSDGVVVGNAVNASQYGLSLAAAHDVVFGAGSVTGTSVAAFLVYADVSYWGLYNVNFHGNTLAISMSGTTNHYAIQGCHFKGNTTNYGNTATGTNRDVTGNITVDGDLVPELRSMTGSAKYITTLTNTHANGNGVLVFAGSTASENALALFTYNGGTSLFTVASNGWVNLGASGARITGDFSNATVANRVIFQTTSPDSATVVGAMPIGVSTTSAFAVYNSTALATAGLGFLQAVSSAVSLGTGHNGAGTTVPLKLVVDATTRMEMNTTGIGFFAATPVAKQVVTGSRGANAAVASVLTALANLGLITDSSS